MNINNNDTSAMAFDNSCVITFSTSSACKGQGGKHDSGLGRWIACKITLLHDWALVEL